MKTGATGIALIKQFEGFSAVPYLCPAQRWTIGYGHLITQRERVIYTSISETQAQRWLVNDLSHAEMAVRQLITLPLQQNQLDALVSFTFNLGTGTLQRSTLRRVINREETSAIPFQWMRWIWGGGAKLPGLARRRAAELALYLSE